MCSPVKPTETLQLVGYSLVQLKIVCNRLLQKIAH
jgi:hypothetical protein